MQFLISALLAAATASASAFPRSDSDSVVVYFGSFSANTADGGPQLPNYTGSCHYQTVQDGADICYGDQVQTVGNTGACPGQNLKGTNFCGVAGILGPKLPKDYVLSADDDCGKRQTALHGATPDEGFRYAEIYDSNSRNVGSCEYIKPNSKNCFRGYEAVLAETFLKCTADKPTPGA